MMSREEFARVQQQMVDMNDENLIMKATIKSIQESLEQAEPLKQAIIQVKSSISREEKQYQEDMNKIQSKINNLSNELRHLDDPNRSKSWDEKRLIKLESSYNEITANLTNQTKIINNLHSQIEELASKSIQITNEIHTSKQRNQNLSNLLHKIQSFGAIQMKISELESSYYTLNQYKKQNAKRISNLSQARTNLAKSDSLLEERLHNLDVELSKVNQSVHSIELDSVKYDNELNGLQIQENSMKIEIDKFEREKIQKEKEQMKLIQIQMYEKEDKENQLKSLSCNLSDLSQSLDQSKLEKNIRINKQASLVRQLSKSIKDKVTDITRARSSSPEVQQLIERQEKEWMQKQQLLERYERIAKKHKELTNCVARKALIVSELHDWLKTVPPSLNHDPLSELNNCYAFALEENRARAEAKAELMKELNSVEMINQQLKQK